MFYVCCSWWISLHLKQLPCYRELLWLFLCLTHSILINAMGYCCWKKDYGGNCYTIACFSWTHKSTNISVDAWVSWSCYGIFMEVKSKLGCFYIHKCNCESYRCNGICCDVFFSNQGKHSCFDHYKHSCFSYIYSHFIRVLDNSINEFNIRHFWDFAITELLFLCVLATSSICSVLYKAWNEGFFEITKMVC